MNKYIILVCVAFGFVQSTFCQSYSISGKVIGGKDKTPIEFATIYLPENEIWAITNMKGEFVLNKVPSGKIILNAHSLGYVQTVLELNVQKNISGLVISLAEDNLKLNEVVVTARRKDNDLSTSYIIDRKTLDHAQILNLSDISSLLPGGKTLADKNLTSDNRFALRSLSNERGNPSFGTAIEVDGVRLQNNSVLDEIKGADTRNVGSANIEYVEVITGIPSVEYGDLSNGIVKVRTRKGKSPFHIEFMTKPNTKQIAIDKGFSLGRAGTLNTSLERTRSIQNLESPHTAYDRNSLALTYENALNNNKHQPLTLTLGLSGNVGGYNTKSDPDTFKDAYTKNRDYTLRGNVRLHWLLNKRWITNLEFSSSFAYSDKLSKVNTNKDSGTSQALIHSLEEGYFIATNYDEDPNAPITLGPTGYWYQLAYTDNKPISYSAKLKANWVYRLHTVTNNLMVGAEFNSSGNKGKGLYYDDMRYAPTWREYRYDELPFLNNGALYVEDKVTIPVSSLSTVQFVAGLRSDITSVKNSEYGTVSSYSPRFSAKYIFWEKADKWVSSLNLYGGWGKAVKLPSFGVLYPSPSYVDQLSFAPGTMSDGTTFYAYYTRPVQTAYNPDLKWQYSQHTEIGIEATLKGGTYISISAYRDKTFNPYMISSVYNPYTYNLTTQEDLEKSIIPVANQKYTVDRQTGIVTVSDKTGAYPAQQLSYKARNTFKGNSKYVNGSPIERRGIDWVIEFPQIQALRTSFRLDGNYYYYKGVDETLIASMPSSAQTMADGNPYKYVGYYAGSSSASTASVGVSNGNLSRQVNANLTVTTHIPKIRLILSMKLESSLYNYDKKLSEYSHGNRAFALENAGDFFGQDYDIYDRDKYVASYPLYYSTWEEPNVKIPFAEKFAWAKENDTALYTELTKLVVKSNTAYYFNANRISSYFSASLNVTKEIGDIASISFYATNFFNNMGMVKASQTGLESSLYNSSYIAKFYYGLSLRLKL